MTIRFAMPDFEPLWIWIVAGVFLWYILIALFSRMIGLRQIIRHENKEHWDKLEAANAKFPDILKMARKEQNDFEESVFVAILVTSPALLPLALALLALIGAIIITIVLPLMGIIWLAGINKAQSEVK